MGEENNKEKLRITVISGAEVIKEPTFSGLGQKELELSVVSRIQMYVFI